MIPAFLALWYMIFIVAKTVADDPKLTYPSVFWL